MGIATSNDVADCPQSGGDDGHFIVIQQSNEPRDDSSVDNFLNSFVRAIGEIRQSPASVGENFFVVVVDKVGQGGKKLSNCRDTGRRILVTAQVGQSPSNVAQECSLILKSVIKC